MADGPLNDIRILDLTHVWAGPLATRILADLGAQVVKVEAPMSRGPSVFHANPMAGFVGGDHGGEPWNRNAVFAKLQRNKQSVAMDLKTDAGRETFLDLVRVADVVMENFSARAMANLRLDYRHLCEANEKIIHVAMPGYGLSGPYSERVAFGPTVEPMSGFTDVMGYSPSEPRNTAMALPDAIAAVNATAAVVSALRYRRKTGKGCLVEMALHEAAVSFCGPWLINEQIETSAKRIGNRHPEMAPHGVYRCAGDDTWVAIACRDDSDWKSLADVISGELDSSMTLQNRQEAHAEIDSAIEAWTRSLAAEEVATLLCQRSVPAGVVRSTPEMISDHQVQSRGFFVPLEHGTLMPGNPIKMSSITTQDWTPCPRLGADNADVLRDWIGMTDESIGELRDRGIIVDRPPR